ncbi:hypothetical protein DPMN_013657 [Dreissena polymorpha]|uniref:Uncharacterized protein n=1 Tax=Dreissena polymorpha TaxID=45954 RepID=A0A9D4N818_DREPO|nr:hypothetical protein DPMN_013657 [Dreissena polymorpha]
MYVAVILTGFQGSATSLQPMALALPEMLAPPTVSNEKLENNTIKLTDMNYTTFVPIVSIPWFTSATPFPTLHLSDIYTKLIALKHKCHTDSSVNANSESR